MAISNWRNDFLSVSMNHNFLLTASLAFNVKLVFL